MGTSPSKKCNICGTSDHCKTEFRYNSVVVDKCTLCNLYFVTTTPDKAAMEKSYKEDMYDNYWKYDGGFYKKHWEEMESYESKFIEDLELEGENINSLLPKRGRLLDFGCFKGNFCNFMKQKGWEVTGVDISKEAIDYGKNKLGLDLYCGELEKVNFSKNSFDLITMWGVIEHLPDPRRIIGELKALLKHQGLMVIKTQSQNSLLTLIGALIYKLSFGRIYSHLEFFYSFEHLYRFSPVTLEKLLASEGFKVIKINYSSAYIAQFASDKAKWYIKLPLGIIQKLSRLLNKQDKMTVFALKE